MNTNDFIGIIKDFHVSARRDLEWRRDITPYKIVISEVMLQQTQVPRAAVKFPQFISRFSDFRELAGAAAGDVLAAWQGMGYNRRALYLHKIAGKIVEEYDGILPQDPQVLESFPGIGHATARSIIAFVYNKPTVFIETNIRRVFIHFFFKDAENIPDRDIYPLVESTLDRTAPREWYYALMDYGNMLSKSVENPNRRSKHYSRQSAFEGSARKVRGFIIRTLLKHKSLEKNQLKTLVADDRFDSIVDGLIKEGFVRVDDRMYFII